jgi:hypothetical protein
MSRRQIVIVSGSGSEELARGSSIRRGDVVTSEVRPGPARSVQHTHALLLESEGASVTAVPYEWTRVLVHGKRCLVTGYQVVGEGRRPADARDHRTFSIVLER